MSHPPILLGIDAESVWEALVAEAVIAAEPVARPLAVRVAELRLHEGRGHRRQSRGLELEVGACAVRDVPSVVEDVELLVGFVESRRLLPECLAGEVQVAPSVAYHRGAEAEDEEEEDHNETQDPEDNADDLGIRQTSCEFKKTNFYFNLFPKSTEKSYIIIILKSW